MINHMQTELEQFQTRNQLLECLRTEKNHIVTAVEKFYTQNSRQESNCLQALEEMIAAFDRVINAGDWESSLFLRNTVKPLKNMREEALQLREQLSGQAPSKQILKPILAAGMIPVYINIFLNKAQRLQDWEQQLKALPQYTLGRPIYRNEDAVKQALRSKLTQVYDAYVCVGVHAADIQSAEFHPSRFDRQGNELLQLMPGSVLSENILEFVYQEKSYYFVDGKLIEKI